MSRKTVSIAQLETPELRRARILASNVSKSTKFSLLLQNPDAWGWRSAGDRGTDACPRCSLRADWFAACDPCLGMIPGVAHACCGHDDPSGAYVVFGDYPNQPAWRIPGVVRLAGATALAYFESLKVGPDRVGS